jgi:hypothetical protein
MDRRRAFWQAPARAQKHKSEVTGGDADASPRF